MFFTFFLDESLEEYVHLLSEVQTAKNSATKYFKCRIQTGQDQAVHAVCFSPEKRQNLHQAFLNKSPVKITAVKHAPNKRFRSQEQEFTIAKHARITPSSLSYSFNEAFNKQLCTINEALGKDLYQTVDIKAKVIKKQENKQVITASEKRKYKADCLIADQTDSVKLVLWENIIDQIHAGKTYHFKHLRVGIFDDVKYLNTNEGTTLQEIDAFHKVNLTTPEITDNTIEGKCIGVQIKRTASCIVCNMAVNESQPEEETVTCNNCNITTLSSVCNTKLVAQIVIQTIQDKKILKFTCFNDAISSFLKITNCQMSLSDIPIEDLKKNILQTGHTKFIADKATQVISQFLPLE